ncbi:MAG: zf-TFIIB domain-containing protein, partial [Candidatus Wallbacteria bacterium]|nr:zf-TFIIB domain-containing protein [Candidatus Wallbacteria bacterium]
MENLGPRLNCPRCQSPLKCVEKSGVTLDYCCQCGGLWFDSGELGQLLSNPQRYETMMRNMQLVGPGCTCPSCGAGMTVLAYLKDKLRIEIDYCPDCQGIWLDKGELELLSAAVAYAFFRKPIFSRAIPARDSSGA